MDDILNLKGSHDAFEGIDTEPSRAGGSTETLVLVLLLSLKTHQHFHP